jgi:hypothetical protein
MLVYVLIGVVALLAFLAIIIAMQPAEFRISRKASMAAPPERVFPEINDHRRWVAWSPWEKFDPAMKRSYDGPPSGVGSIYSWTGNKNVGEGRSTIIESRPNELVRFRLEFIRPFTATNDGEFLLSPEDRMTVVEWAISGRRNFMFKAMGLVMNMDKMCGRQFEQGLVDLKAVVESASSHATTQPNAELAATR